ncbi:SUKH-3 domain-containing protein [Spirosoma gilvum]
MVGKSIGSILADLGWTKGRNVDISKIKEHLSQTHYPLFNEVESFLEEFAFLKSSDGQTVSFDVINAEESVDPLWIQDDYSKRIGTDNLCIIGQALNSHLALFMDDKGRIYGGYDDFLCLVGSSRYEALEKLYFDHLSMMEIK